MIKIWNATNGESDGSKHYGGDCGLGGTSLRESFAFMWYTTPTLIRPRYSPTQEIYSLKLFPYHFEIDGAVKIIAGV